MAPYPLVAGLCGCSLGSLVALPVGPGRVYLSPFFTGAILFQMEVWLSLLSFEPTVTIIPTTHKIVGRALRLWHCARSAH